MSLEKLLQRMKKPLRKTPEEIKELQSKIRKAKDHVEMFRKLEAASGLEDAIPELIVNLMNEVNVLAEIRGSHTDNVMLSILREIDMKYRSISRQIPVLKREGFRNHVLELLQVDINA